MEVAVILGTRPEIIKMAPVIRELERRKEDYFVLHTGQHYSYNLDMALFEQMELPLARHNLDVGSGTHGEETAKILVGAERVLREENPDVVLVEGDTNSVLAGALAAAKLGIKVGHVEAGLRSYDRRMPEEINRTLADHCSDILFAPTEESQRILLSEGVPEGKVYVTGNTIVDAVYQNLDLANRQAHILSELDLEPRGYFLVTVHRQENVDNKDRFGGIFKGLEQLAAKYHLPIIYPIHPRSRKRMEYFDLNANGVELIEPVDYWSFLRLEANARLVITDSGGVQEETCILGVPCVTSRDNTERPETLKVRSNILAGSSPEKLVECVELMLDKDNDWKNPFGDGKAGERIVQVIAGP